MQLELRCPCCAHGFEFSADSPAGEVLDRVTEQGPWRALGDGETFEDLIHAALCSDESVRCAECGVPVPINEENLGRLSQAILARW